ncbi:MAG: metallophosphoesterase [Clostridia bacterium]|nr:metallophosphoesterase [Clostridia bacterium]
MKRTTKLMASLLALMMLLTLALPVSFAQGKSTGTSRTGLRVMVISDTHYILERMIKDTEDYRHAVNLDQKVYNESEAVVNEQLEKVRQAKPEVLLLNGDLTKDGEYLGHKVFAEKLRQLKKDVPGMKVYVTNGNHDINNSDAQEFNTKDGKAVPAKKTSQKDFLKLYKDITWDDATVREVYTPPAGTEAGGTSYMARPKKGIPSSSSTRTATRRTTRKAAQQSMRPGATFRTTFCSGRPGKPATPGNGATRSSA